MDTPNKRMAYSQFAVVRSDGHCQRQSKAIQLATAADVVPECFTVTQDRPPAIRWQGQKVQAITFITRKRRGAESSGNGAHETI